jgi:diadenosine tetraphosphate (Ap4A) HIT family hydrolase
LPSDRIISQNPLAVVVRDRYPISRGHTLILPKRHLASFFDATPEEQAALLELIRRVRELLVKEFAPDGFNIGINDGEAAGQTVRHHHVHVIPRYEGDMLDPRGGVRWIFPDRAVYWDRDDLR